MRKKIRVKKIKWGLYRIQTCKGTYRACRSQVGESWFIFWPNSASPDESTNTLKSAKAMIERDINGEDLLGFEKTSVTQVNRLDYGHDA